MAGLYLVSWFAATSVGEREAVHDETGTSQDSSGRRCSWECHYCQLLSVVLLTLTHRPKSSSWSQDRLGNLLHKQTTDKRKRTRLTHEETNTRGRRLRWPYVRSRCRYQLSQFPFVFQGVFLFFSGETTCWGDQSTNYVVSSTSTEQRTKRAKYASTLN